MKNPESWTPTKFERTGEALRGSRDPGRLAATSRLSTDLQAEVWRRNLPLHARGVLADLGCGTVPLYGEYRDLVSETICIDWGNSLHRNIHLDYECDLTQRLPLADASVDTIVLADVLEHVPDPASVWREMYRIARPSAKALVCVPFLYPLHELPHDYFRYTEFGLRRLAESAGFSVVSIEAMGGAPEVVTNIVSKVMRRIPRVGTPLAVAAQGATSLLRKTPIGRKISASTARNFPLSYFLVAQKR